MVRLRSLSASDTKPKKSSTPFQTRTRSMASRANTPPPIDDESDDEITLRSQTPQNDPPGGEATPQVPPRIHNPHSTSPHNPPAEQLPANPIDQTTDTTTTAASNNN